jgi:uncharacterized membrane protein
MQDRIPPARNSNPRYGLEVLLARRTEGVEDDELGLERIIFFSDAIFAIAITLLALEIRLPETAEGEVTWGALGALWPKYLSYIISFLTIGGFWISHHRKFRLIERYDTRLMWLNLLALASVAFLPFPTALLGGHGNEKPAAVFYALAVIASGLLFWAVWRYAAHNHRLIRHDVDDWLIQRGDVRAWVPIVFFAASIPVALGVHPYLAEVLWGFSALTLARY